MISPKLKLFPKAVSPAAAAPLMQSCIGLLTINWLCQGMRGMDRKELCFRLICEASLGLLIAWPIGAIFEGSARLASALLLAHGVMFLVNGQFWVCIRYCRFYSNTEHRLNAYLQCMATRLKTIAWLEEAVIIGSAALGYVRTARSDIDLRIVVPQGWSGWVRANLLLARLRFEALIRRIPLDVYAYDSPRSLLRFHQHEPIAVIKDDGFRVRGLFVDWREVKEW